MTEPPGLFSIEADVDVEKVTEEIEESVRQKVTSGAYPAEVMEDLAPPDPESDDLLGHTYRDSPAFLADLAVSEDSVVDPFALTHLAAEVSEAAYVSPEVTTASRKAVVGPAVVRTKRLIQSSIRWYVTGVTEQLNEFTNRTSVAIQVIVSRISSLSDHLERLEARVADGEAKSGGLHETRADQDDDLEGLRREIASLRSELDTLRDSRGTEGADR